jgi:secondary thiamine-phosphate synthase enzyme
MEAMKSMIGNCTWSNGKVEIQTRGKGLYEITSEVERCLRGLLADFGLCHLYLPHTSASLLISESYDPTARQDLAAFLERLVPENQPWMQHTLEGADDSSSHLRAGLLPTNLSIPIENGRLALGQWQGIYLVEHRSHGHLRQVRLDVLMFHSSGG